VYSVQTVAVTPNQKRWKKYAKPQSKKGIARPNSTEASKKTQHMTRVRALMLLGGKCETCGINDMRVLQVDHVDNNGAAERREIGRGYAMMKRVLANPSAYRCLCANCHAIRHSKEIG